MKIFAPTKYAQTLNQAVINEKEGDYEQAAAGWAAVLEQHSTSSLAYMAKGRECMRSKDYTAAMSWFRLADDQDYYSKAFRLYRQDGLANMIGWGILALAVLASAWLCSKVGERNGRQRRRLVRPQPCHRL